MEITKVKKLPCVLLFLDFEKAFDSLQWDFLEKCLEKFNFGPDFRRYRGYYMPARGYEFYLRVVNSISHE